MTDIVERLRSTHNDTWPRQVGFGDLNNEAGLEAADEIERLRIDNKRIDRLEIALNRIAGHVNITAAKAREIAAEALQE